MMIPELPSYLSSLGGAEHKGLPLLPFLPSRREFSRPFSGKLADTVGRLPVMYVGTFACVIPSVPTPIGFCIRLSGAAFFHGFSTGFKPTGTAAYVADIVPDGRRGEAMGTLGICLSLGASASPPLGSWLVKQYDINAMFYASALLAILSMLILTNLKETLPEKQPSGSRS